MGGAAVEVVAICWLKPCGGGIRFCRALLVPALLTEPTGDACCGLKNSKIIRLGCTVKCKEEEDKNRLDMTSRNEFKKHEKVPQNVV